MDVSLKEYLVNFTLAVTFQRMQTISGQSYLNVVGPSASVWQTVLGAKMPTTLFKLGTSRGGEERYPH